VKPTCARSGSAHVGTRRLLLAGAASLCAAFRATFRTALCATFGLAPFGAALALAGTCRRLGAALLAGAACRHRLTRHGSSGDNRRGKYPGKLVGKFAHGMILFKCWANQRCQRDEGRDRAGVFATHDGLRKTRKFRVPDLLTQASQKSLQVASLIHARFQRGFTHDDTRFQKTLPNRTSTAVAPKFQMRTIAEAPTL